MACVHLRADGGDAILTARPVVRVLYVDQVAHGGGAPLGIPVSHKAFVYDGTTYVYIALSASLSASIGDAEGQLHVGSAVRLDHIRRIPNPPPGDSPVVVTAFTLQYAQTAGCDHPDHPDYPDSPSLIFGSLSPGAPNDPHVEVQRLSAERESQYKRRKVLEHILKDICLKDLAPGDCVRVAPAMYEAMMRMAQLTD
ncbi:hypothetical protein OH77DRAFT_1517200 [Trametes cingulata]|nr:hypothetical protein OH77DRAFT_1517200 [Trametes cingulata]